MRQPAPDAPAEPRAHAEAAWHVRCSLLSMVRTRRSLCAPFVVTVSMTSACSGDAGPTARDTMSATDAAAASDANGGAPATDGPEAATYLPCPSSVPGRSTPCALAPGATCQYTVECQSGSKDFTLQCSDDRGEFGQLVWVVISPFDCAEHRYDSCPGTELYCPYAWTTGKPATNPPGVCPSKLPPSGENCWSEFSGPTSPCGYPCDPETKSGWTVATCSYTPSDGGSTQTWTHDGACGT